MTSPPIHEAYKTLIAHYGPQHWWPAESNIEMMIGAILTQNTSWTNVEKALNNLRQRNALSISALVETPRKQLADWIRPAGYFNQKSGYIMNMITTISSRFNGSLAELFKLPPATLREELLSWKGIGPETADCIMLYAARHPVFVVDAYTRRIALRHHWIDEMAKYDGIVELFTTHLPEDVQLFNEYHALLVRLCKDYCITKPKCNGCPLECYLPSDQEKKWT